MNDTQKQTVKVYNKGIVSGAGAAATAIVTYFTAHVDLDPHFAALIVTALGSVITYAVVQVRNHSPELSNTVESFLSYFAKQRKTQNGQDAKP